MRHLEETVIYVNTLRELIETLMILQLHITKNLWILILGKIITIQVILKNMQK
jgi:hypothetical protein